MWREFSGSWLPLTYYEMRVLPGFDLDKTVRSFEDMCVMMCRYAHQGDLDAVEHWPLDLLQYRFASLSRVLDAESKAVKK